ncbi:MAG: FlgD immunoglobulin-like domain containing protein, partial [bacterium]
EISAGEAPGYYAAPASDWYGLVVFPAWNQATPTGYRVNVEKLGDCTALESGFCLEKKLYTAATGPADDYTFLQEVGYWAAVAVLPDATDDKALNMFTECDKNGILLATSSLAGTGDAEIIVGDFNHTQFDNYFPVVSGGDYSKNFSIELDDGPDIFPVPGELTGQMSGTSGECNLVKVWDVYLDAGVEYEFFFYKSGLKDPHIALFRNPGACAYWVGRDQAQFEMAANGYHNYTAPQSDWYGLVLFADERAPETSYYQIQIQPLDDCEPLGPRTCVEREGWPRDFEINQSFAYWSAIAVSTTGYDSKNLYLFTQCDAKGTLLASTYGDGTHLIVGDFNHNALGTYYATVSSNDVNALYTVEADADGEILTTGTYVADLVGRNPSSCNLVRMYDVYLESGVTYQIGFTRSGSADMRLALFRNPGNGTYWAGLSSAALQAMESGNYSYTAPATDWYGIAAYANKRNEPGSYSIAVFEEGATGIDPAGIDPEKFALYQNAPNPFNPSTVIRYDVPAGGGQVTLAVYDVNGRLVRTLRSGVETAGKKSVTWDARDNNGARVASGVYFYRLVAPGFDETHKMVVTK